MQIFGLYLGKDKFQNATTCVWYNSSMQKKMEESIAVEAGISVKKFEAANITFHDYALEVASRYKVKNSVRAFTSTAKGIPEKIVLASVDRIVLSKIIYDVLGGCSQNSRTSEFIRCDFFLQNPGNKVFLTLDELKQFLAVEPVSHATFDGSKEQSWNFRPPPSLGGFLGSSCKPNH